MSPKFVTYLQEIAISTLTALILRLRAIFANCLKRLILRNTDLSKVHIRPEKNTTAGESETFRKATDYIRSGVP